MIHELLMLTSHNGSEDGDRIQTYEAGRTYAFTEAHHSQMLAELFVRQGWAVDPDEDPSLPTVPTLPPKPESLAGGGGQPDRSDGSDRSDRSGASDTSDESDAREPDARAPKDSKGRAWPLPRQVTALAPDGKRHGFPSITAFCRAAGVSRQIADAALKGERADAGGWKPQYLQD